MKFLIHSNAPRAKTGYGVQTAHLAELLHDAGHDVAVSATWGQQGVMGSWRPDLDGGTPRHPELWPEGERIPIYQCGYDPNGVDVLHHHAQHFFGGDPLGGWIIPLIDIWSMLPNPMMTQFNVAVWVPVDHFPVPRDVRAFFTRNPDAVPIAMSRFGESLLLESGLEPVYIPLTVDTRVYKPTTAIPIGDRVVTGRDLIGQSEPIPDGAFLVSMVAMNKGWARDRKGFNEAFTAFSAFWKTHQDAVLYVHTDWSGLGMEGIDLKELAIHRSIPPHAIRFPQPYPLRQGWTSEMMAAVYTDSDVLLSPSHGEGFCVPLIEAQACGTPVIVTDATTQPELVGAGWRVGGQPEWDPAQHASYVVPYVGELVKALEAAYDADRAQLAIKAQAFAAQFDTERVFVRDWLPFLESLEPAAPSSEVERAPMEKVAVIVPAMRGENLGRLASSFEATADDSADLLIVHDDDFELPKTVQAWGALDTGEKHTTYAEKVNLGMAATTHRADWLLLVGDDVEFKPGWLEAARALSDRYDVIGTNDSSNGVKNPDVAAGRHADHFFVRRAYVEQQGACLDGPGVLAPTAYHHWYVDREIVELAKARGVFTPCLSSVIEHHHPGYAGREDLRQADPVYMTAVEYAEEDAETWRGRAPLVAGQRVSRGRT